MEDRIGDLYVSYGERYSSTRDLWVLLVEEERNHALMLISLSGEKQKRKVGASKSGNLVERAKAENQEKELLISKGL